MSFSYDFFSFIENPGWNVAATAGTFVFMVLLCAYYLLRGRVRFGGENVTLPPPVTAGRETLADVPDIWSFRKRPGLRDSQNEAVVPPPLPQFIPKRPDGFLSSLWPTVLQDPAFNSEPFFALSSVLHHETHSLYKLITERSTWSPADRSSLQVSVDRALQPQEKRHAECSYFTCPPESIAPEIVERCDAWALVNGLMNMEGSKNPVVTSLQINERVGRCIFGSMELGLAKMNARRRVSPSAQPIANDTGVRSKEVDAWLAMRQQSNFTLAVFKQAYADGDPNVFSRAVLELQQDAEALWEINRRKGNSSVVFKKAMRKIYDETDRTVIRHLAAAHGRPEADFRFYPAGNCCEDDFFDPGRAVTYQMRARPGESVPRKKTGTFGKIELVAVKGGETAWVDLPEQEIIPVYLEAFYRVAGADRWYPEMSPKAFAEAMGQYFGERLPVEYLGEE